MRVCPRCKKNIDDSKILLENHECIEIPRSWEEYAKWQRKLRGQIVAMIKIYKYSEDGKDVSVKTDAIYSKQLIYSKDCISTKENSIDLNIDLTEFYNFDVESPVKKESWFDKIKKFLRR